MANRAVPISLAGAHLDDTRHVCAFFRSDDEEYRALLPFIREGIERGEKAIHVVNPRQRDDHLRRLAGAGIDTTGAEVRGQLEIRANTDTYLPDGRFDPDRMLALFGGLAGGDAERGFARSRIVCRMDWCVDDRVSVDDVIEFESRVNEVWRRHDDAVICTYDAGRLGGAAVIDIMRTHPMVIVGDTLHRNPFFVPPERFVPELMERRARQATHRVPAD